MAMGVVSIRYVSEARKGIRLDLRFRFEYFEEFFFYIYNDVYGGVEQIICTFWIQAWR